MEVGERKSVQVENWAVEAYEEQEEGEEAQGEEEHALGWLVSAYCLWTKCKIPRAHETYFPRDSFCVA